LLRLFSGFFWSYALLLALLAAWKEAEALKLVACGILNGPL